jgi:hypothetical protein
MWVGELNYMNIEQQLLYLNINYKVLYTEQEFIVHPAAFSLLPITTTSLQYPFSSSFHIKDYRLILDRITMFNGESSNLGGMRIDGYEKSYLFQEAPVTYNGAILIGANQIKEYNIKGNKMNCFSYQSVFELIFEDGILITTIDQSKAMSRIRKNLELGLRSLSKSRDVRLIQHFINSSLVGDYKTFRLNNSRLKYLKEMKNDYPSTSLIRQINSI